MYRGDGLMGEFKGSYKGIGEMLRSDFMVEVMRVQAERVKAVAEAIAPVGSEADGDKHPGLYKSSFRVESGVREGKKPRAVGRVVNDAPYAFHVEFGSKDTPKHRTLGKALGIVGATGRAQSGTGRTMSAGRAIFNITAAQRRAKRRRG